MNMHAYPMLLRATQRYAPREILRKTAETKVYPLHILHSEVYFSSILLVLSYTSWCVGHSSTTMERKGTQCAKVKTREYRGPNPPRTVCHGR